MPRMSADARREELVAIAFRHFAEGGYAGTSTETSSTGSGIGGSGLVALTHTLSTSKSANRRSAIAVHSRSSVR